MTVGIIPARFASTRLMGKPLAEIGDKPLIQHTYESATKSKLLNKIIIAVDDKKVAQVCRDFGAEVITTPKNITTGSERIAIAVKKLDEADIIVNIQGDEPFISGKMIDEAIEPLLFDNEVNISTLAKRIESVAELQSPDVVKVVFDYNNYALYFSRSPIPFVRDIISAELALEKTEIYKHIGLYVYRKESLFKFAKLKVTDLERSEKLEQLRMLENGMKIKIVVTEFDSMSVDTPDDLKRARTYYDWLQKRKKDEGSE
ncbi:3-deoxy-manno-octulosonate cytidylyltransferase [bacterium BMS3Abin03]|jgi:3-deoxy-manno-octulosonate cytidylyltransferase (CMP-KDO synthetase)|nr:3-deoxy-manno-octulosonate cytidylyltransferase [bacterium BMS3Abin03]MCG6961560.1 3-deoxy-manno-octulosonate cytidylyltransferase [bacterium BMS3Abin03]